MLSMYSDLQAKIKEVSPLTDFILCSAHSFNLVGSYMASCYEDLIPVLILSRMFVLFFQLLLTIGFYLKSI